LKRENPLFKGENMLGNICVTHISHSNALMKDTTFFSPPMSEVKEAKPPSSSEEGPLELGIATAFREYPRISKHL